MPGELWRPSRCRIRQTIEVSSVRSLLCLLALVSVSGNLIAETQYVRDTLYVELRSGQSLQHRIVHRGLPSGTAVTILERGADGKYTRVKTRGGTEGWIQTQYLMDQPAAKDRLIKAEARLKALSESNSELKQQLSGLQSQQSTTAGERDQLNNSNQKLQTELDRIKTISANALQLDRDVKKLRLANEELQNQVDLLSADKQRLSDDNSNEAFINGAFAVLIGVFITLIVPRLWPSKKSSDWA